TTAPCECGRTHVRILRVTGRNDDMLIIRGVNVYPSQVEAVLVGLPDVAPHYQLVVQRKGSLDEVSIEAEAQPGVPESEYARIGKQITHQVKSMIGISTAVEVKKPGEMPRSQGKAVRVRDLRPKGKASWPRVCSRSRSTAAHATTRSPTTRCTSTTCARRPASPARSRAATAANAGRARCSSTASRGCRASRSPHPARAAASRRSRACRMGDA